MADTGIIGVGQGAFPNAPPINLPSLPDETPSNQSVPLKITVRPEQVQVADNSKSDDWFGTSVIPTEALETGSPPPTKTSSEPKSQTDWFSSSVIPTEAIESGDAPNPEVGIADDVGKTMLGQTLPMAAVAPLGMVTYPLSMAQHASDYLGAGAANLVKSALGKPTEKYEPEPDWIATPATMLNDVADATGHPLYQPQTTAGKYTDTIGQFLLGGGWMGATSKAKSVGEMASNVGKTIVPSVLGGVTSETSGQITQGTQLEEPARILGAAIGAHSPKVISKGTGPLTGGGRRNIAISNIMENSQNPDELNQAIQSRSQQLPPPSGPTSDIVPQQQQTLAELAPGDQNLAAYQQKVLGAAHSVGGQDFANQINDLNTARHEANDNFTRAMNTGDPNDVGKLFTSHIDQLNQENDTLEHAQKNISAGIEPNAGLSDLGSQATSQFEAGRAAAKEAEDKAWQELEPYKQIPSDPTLIGETVNENINQIDHLAGDELHPREQALYNTVDAWGNDMQPFGRITSFARNLNDAISEVGRQQGFKSAPVQRLMNLKNSVKNTVSGKVGEIHAAEQHLVNEGRMLPEETLFNSLSDQTNGWLAKRKTATARGNSSVGPGGYSSGRSQTIRDPSRTEVPKDGIPRGTEGNQGLPRSGELALTPQEAFSKANKSTKERAETFDNPKVLKSAFGKTNNEYTLSEGQRALKFFQPGEGGAKAVQEATKSGVSKEIISDVALNKLRKDGVLATDGTIDTAKLDRWVTRHQSAISELPELEKTLRKTGAIQDKLATQAENNRLLKSTFDKSAAAKFLGNEKPEQVVGKILRGDKPEASIDDVLARIGNNKAAIDGLKSATLDHLNEKFSGSDQNLRKSQSYKQYLQDNRAALVKLIGAPSHAMLLRMVNQDIDALKVGTGAKAKGYKPEHEKTSLLHELREVGGPEAEAALIGAGAEHVADFIKNHPVGVTVASMVWLSKIMKAAGLRKIADLKTQIVLHPEKFASAFAEFQKKKDIPVLLKRNFSSSLMKTLPQAEAVNEEREKKLNSN